MITPVETPSRVGKAGVHGLHDGLERQSLAAVKDR
jgi:hypothetical protein